MVLILCSLSMCAPGCLVSFPFPFPLLDFCVKVFKFLPAAHYQPASHCAVWILHHTFLTAPFTSSLGTLPGCLSGMCLLPTSPCWCPQPSRFPQVFSHSLPFQCQHTVLKVSIHVLFFDVDMVHAVTFLSRSDFIRPASL